MLAVVPKTASERLRCGELLSVVLLSMLLLMQLLCSAAPLQGQGLSEKQMALCDGFVYIPQYGPGTASLNVTVAASIILQHFAVWAGYSERERAGAKYVVDERPPRTVSRGKGARHISLGRKLAQGMM